MAQVFTDNLAKFQRVGQVVSGSLIKTGPGILIRVIHGISILGTNSATLYDGIDNTGAVIHSFNTTLSAAPANIEYGVSFTRGLFIVTVGIGTPDLCVVYL
jgi:hypothetical protein